ncbi:MAG: DNA recombination protein RmuC [Arenicella sp.]
MQELLHTFFASIGIRLSSDALLVIVSVLSLVLGYFLSKFIHRRQLRAQQNVAAHALETQRKDDLSFFDDQLDQLSHTFSSLSQQALSNNSDSFLTLAKQSFLQLHSSSTSELKASEKSFADLIKPIQQSISDTDRQLKKLDTDRKITEVKLGEQISNMLDSQHTLQSETRNLVTALRRPEVRGQWGELSLRRLVELAGMSEYCDFDEQISVTTPEGLLRPDMLIRLPSERQLVVDVKTPLDAYLSATESCDPDQQKAFLVQHHKNVKQRIKELGLKQYWQQFERSPDFVILFIPGDQFLSAALDVDKSLLEFALQHRILLATPTSLVGLLRTIAYGWNQDLLSKNSEQIRALGGSLYQRLQTLTDHLNKLGRHLDQSVEQFNKLTGSYQSSTLPAARKLSELGISDEPVKEVTNSKAAPVRSVARDSKLD